MDIGIGLPAVADPALLLDWARRADDGPFHTLGLLDRLSYHNPEPLVTLAMLAGATSRIRLQTEVLLAPLREPLLLAKQVATLDNMSAGRFVLGLGVGNRPAEYAAVGVDYHQRGRLMDDHVALLRRVWSGTTIDDDGQRVGPIPITPGGPPILFGGFSKAVIDRTARCGDGFLAAASADYTDHLFRGVRSTWRQAGRAGEPRLVAQVNVALGELAAQRARTMLHAYYGAHAQHMIAGLLTTAGQLRSTIIRFRELGAHELMCYAWAQDAAQVDRLAEVVGERA